MADNAGLSAALDGIPMVADAAARDARFPLSTRKQNQRVFRLDTGVTQRWSGSAWVDDTVRQINVRAFGAVGDGTNDDTTAITAAKAAAIAAGLGLHFPNGNYRTAPLAFTAPIRLTGEPGARITLNATGGQTAVVTFDFTGGGAFFNYGAGMTDIILDGNGLVADGLLLKNVISSTFGNIRATNVTTAGFHLAWAQLCTFVNPVCSANVEAFTTTPVNGLLVDGATSSSANTFINATIEHVSGSGIKGVSLINALFLNGTSEGNAIGIELGETTDVGRVAMCNTVVGMDLEANTTTDIMLRLTASCNDFSAVKAGFSSPEVQILGAKRNTFHGGQTGGFTLDAASSGNRIENVTLLGAGRTVTDAGTFNTRRNLYNLTDGTRLIADVPMRGRANHVLTNGQTATIDVAVTSYAAVTATTGAAAITIAAPTHVVDGADLDITVHNASGGALTVTWNAAFHFTGWTDPANTKTRSVRFRYDSNYAAWYAVALTAADQPA